MNNLIWYEWLAQVGTNVWIGSFLTNNFLLISGLGAFIFMILKIIAKRTPSPEDDKIIAEMQAAFNNKINSLVKRTQFKNL
jgi:hypothetical protein